jgi:Derlin-2/3
LCREKNQSFFFAKVLVFVFIVMANRAAGIADADSISGWFREIPPLTKFFFTGTLLMGMAAQFNLIPSFFGGGGVGALIFDWHSVKSKFHVWRLVTPFLFAGTFSMNFVIHLYVLYENCRRYESNPFNTGAGGTSADFLYMVVLGMAVFVMLAIFESSLGLGMQVMSEPILYYILYVWSRKDPETVVNMWGFKFKALYLPWVYMGLRVLMGGSITLMLVGVGVGHLYYFLVDVVPNSHGTALIKTPGWCVDLIERVTGATQPSNTGFFAAAPRARQGQDGAAAAGGGGGAEMSNGNGTGMRHRAAGGGGGRAGGYQWGRGQVLGTN